MGDFSSASSQVPSPVSTTPTSLSSPEIHSLSIKDVSDEDRERAAKVKAKANAAFISHNFTEAVKLYSEAIEVNPTDATFWCNRAAARTKLEEYGFALADASKAIEIDPKYTKAYYRRATCYLQIAKPQIAIADFKKVLAFEPKNETVRTQLTATQKLVRKIEFEKAIEMEEEKNAVDRCLEIIAEGSCEAESDYTGPVLHQTEDGKYTITHAFIIKMIDWFKQGRKLPRRYAWEIVLGAHAQLAKEESLVQVHLDEGETCDVIGDVHGQFYDLLHLYSLTGTPKADHYLLMNGDLVDRGSWSMEVILTVFAYKWLYPNRMFINRGNHEAKEMNRTYGFEGEAKHKHGEQSYKLFAHVFTTIPLATLVSATKKSTNVSSKTILSPDGLKQYFIVHGGLFSKDGVTLDDIRKIPRIGRQPGQEGLIHLNYPQLLWTDPQEAPGRGPSKRGVGLSFGPDVTKKWCTLNSITGVIRSHEVRPDGYAVEHDGLCTTVFSAPNYVDQVGNKGAYIRIDASGDLRYYQFEAQPHPPLKPMAYATGGLANLMMM
ncbi:phosphoprotein phosphatase [Scleroderma citrinum]